VFELVGGVEHVDAAGDGPEQASIAGGGRVGGHPQEQGNAVAGLGYVDRFSAPELQPVAVLGGDCVEAGGGVRARCVVKGERPRAGIVGLAGDAGEGAAVLDRQRGAVGEGGGWCGTVHRRPAGCRRRRARRR
jgi:hypothetical protein